MDKSKARAALERDLARHRSNPTPLPRSGWIRAIRDALGMSTRDMAERVGLSQQRISQIEQNERDRSLTLDTLDRIADALDCRVEYVLVPHLPLDEIVWEQARKKAAAQVAEVDHTMALENQRPESDSTRQRIDEVAKRLVDKRGLWS